MLYQYNAPYNATHVPIALFNECTNALCNNGNNVLTQYPRIAPRI